MKHNLSGLLAEALFCMIISSASVHADTPLAAAQDLRITSNNGQFFALSLLADSHGPAQTRVYAKGWVQQPLWQIGGYYPVLFLADNGKGLVAGHAEGNLLPETTRPDEALIRFLSPDQSIKTVRVGEVLPDLKSLPKTVSHRAWGNYLGFDRAGRFGIGLYDGRSLWFDVTSGKLLETRMPAGPVSTASAKTRGHRD